MTDPSTLTVDALRGWQQRIEHRLEAIAAHVERHFRQVDPAWNDEYGRLQAQWDAIEREWTRRYGFPIDGSINGA
jgi:hypothetical protein